MNIDVIDGLSMFFDTRNVTPEYDVAYHMETQNKNHQRQSEKLYALKDLIKCYMMLRI